MDTKKGQKSPKDFYCNDCDYTTQRKSHYTRHMMTSKHKKIQMDTKKGTKQDFSCNCGKNYNFISGLYKHKKKCEFQISEEQKNEIIDLKDEIINILLKENKDFKDLLMEQSKMMLDITKNPQIMTHSNNNSHNKTFNLQVFLNETCKDAMNIMDFVDSIKIQMEDLENVGKLGYINGISNIIMKNLNALDVTQRPVHCSDSKREVLYVKDKDKWEKEDENNSKMRKAIKRVEWKNSKMIRDWKDIHPDHDNSFSKTSDIYQQIVIESMGGKDYETTDTEARIIKNIAKHVVINKL